MADSILAQQELSGALKTLGEANAALNAMEASVYSKTNRGDGEASAVDRVSVLDPETAAEAFFGMVKSNDTARVKECLHLGADVKMRDDVGATALLTSVQIGDSHLGMTRLLLTKGALLGEPKEALDQVLKMATDNANVNTAKALSEYALATE